MMNDTTINNMVSNVLTASVEETFKSGARFVSLTYTNANGETSKYTLIMGINILSLYKSDLRTLNFLKSTGVFKGVDAVALEELISSVKNSLDKGIGNNDAYTLKGYYTPVTSNGEIKLHTDDDGTVNLYVRGYVLNKTVIVKGEYKTVNSSPKTLAKNKIEKTLKGGKIRTFKINVNNLHGVKVNGTTIEIN